MQNIAIPRSCCELHGWRNRRHRCCNHGLEPLAEAGTVMGQPHGSWNNSELRGTISVQRTEILLNGQEEKHPGLFLHSIYPPIIH